MRYVKPVKNLRIIAFFVTWAVLAHLSSTISFAAQVPPESSDDASLELQQGNEIDWSKPIVSRGFGYEAQNGADARFETEYKKGQIAYFFKQYAKALTIWKPLAKQNHIESIASLAWLYHAGLGVEQDYAKAFELYKKAANAGNAVAQNNLGALFEKGYHGDKDLTKAREWYKRSAENGYRFGQYNYANFLANGDGGKQDVKEAIRWYRKAAEQDMPQAQDKLGELEN